MSPIRLNHLNALKSAGVKVVEYRTDESVVIEVVVHCSCGGGKKWTETQNITLRGAESVWKYLDTIS